MMMCILKIWNGSILLRETKFQKIYERDSKRMKKIIEWWNWFAEGKQVFMCLLVIVAALLLCMYTWKSETSIRVSGYCLQFIGMLFAIFGLLDIRKHLQQPLLRDLFINWIQRFPILKKRSPQNYTSDRGVGFAGSVSVDGIWIKDNPDRSLEDRVSLLAENLEIIRKKQRQHDDLIAKLKGSHEEQVKEVKKQNQEIREEFQKNLETLHIGGWINSMVGLIWLTVGITLSTLSQEIYTLIIYLRQSSVF